MYYPFSTCPLHIFTRTQVSIFRGRLLCRVGQGPRTEEARVEACYQLISDSLSSHCGAEEVNSKYRGDTPGRGLTLTALAHTGSSESRLLLLTPTETDWSNADQPGPSPAQAGLSW